MNQEQRVSGKTITFFAVGLTVVVVTLALLVRSSTSDVEWPDNDATQESNPAVLAPKPPAPDKPTAPAPTTPTPNQPEEPSVEPAPSEAAAAREPVLKGYAVRGMRNQVRSLSRHCFDLIGTEDRINNPRMSIALRATAKDGVINTEISNISFQGFEGTEELKGCFDEAVAGLSVEADPEQEDAVTMVSLSFRVPRPRGKQPER